MAIALLLELDQAMTETDCKAHHAPRSTCTSAHVNQSDKLAL